MNDNITYVGLDTHKKQHKLAAILPESDEIIEMVIANTTREIGKMVKKLKKLSDRPIHFCYEAGVCGFTLKRRIEALDCRCAVIAPTLIPRKPGERIKTDRRDAKKLLALFKAGLLTEVFPPDPEQEAARDLTRLRETAMINRKRIRQQLVKFLTRHGYIFTDGYHWTCKHLHWLRNLEFDESLLCDVFDSYFTELQHCDQRLESIDKQLEQLSQTEPYKEIVGLLRCFHGIDTLTAISVITEIFDFGRFESPRKFMSYLGLTPSESSSGDKQKKGGICKTGNKRVRRLLNECSWHYRHPSGVSKALKARRAGQPQWAIDIADSAGRRLRQRYRKLINNGKMPCKANIAVARELAGFIWAIVNEYELRKKYEMRKAV